MERKSGNCITLKIPNTRLLGVEAFCSNFAGSSEYDLKDFTMPVPEDAKWGALQKVFDS